MGKTVWTQTSREGEFQGEQDVPVLEVEFRCESCANTFPTGYEGNDARDALEGFARRSGWRGDADEWYCPSHAAEAPNETGVGAPPSPGSLVGGVGAVAEVVWEEGSDRDHAERVYYDPSVLTGEEKSGIMLAADVLRFGIEEESRPYARAVDALDSLVRGDVNP